ncbi:MAG TPA: hypothetical protein VIV12_06590 [Streptosporangiaceae bacterium]
MIGPVVVLVLVAVLIAIALITAANDAAYQRGLSDGRRDYETLRKKYLTHLQDSKQYVDLLFERAMQEAESKLNRQRKG